MKKKYVFIVMMNVDPMGHDWDWQPHKAFLTREEAKACVKDLWDREWHGYIKKEIPIEKHEWLDIDKVELG